MSGFSADWLALREPADHRARNAELLAATAGRFAGRASVSVVDLGCGTGSNLRALAPVLPSRQSWTLVDYDPALLAAARLRLASWADRASATGGGLALVKDGRSIEVSFRQADLANDLEGVLNPRPDLVTAAALFDLVSRGWIDRFARAVAATGATFYTALTYNGQESWDPPHPADGAIRAAFHAHQGGDKGFGPSAGPGASAALEAAFRASGYHVRTADSPWRLGSGDAALVHQLARGVAQAVRETGRLQAAVVAEWLEARLSAACTVGHTDLLAVPL